VVCEEDSLVILVSAWGVAVKEETCGRLGRKILKIIPVRFLE
jgi:hypothetical protein